MLGIDLRPANLPEIFDDPISPLRDILLLCVSLEPRNPLLRAIIHDQRGLRRLISFKINEPAQPPRWVRKPTCLESDSDFARFAAIRLPIAPRPTKASWSCGCQRVLGHRAGNIHEQERVLLALITSPRYGLANQPMMCEQPHREKGIGRESVTSPLVSIVSSSNFSTGGVRTTS